MKYSLIALALISLSSASFAAQSVNETRKVESDGVVDIENVRGQVTILAWDKAEVQVEGTLDSEAKQLIFTSSGSRTKIKVEVPQQLPRGEGSTLTIRVPKASSVKTNFVSTDLNASGFHGGLQSDSVSGNLTLKNISGRIEIDAVSGDINAELSSEHVEVATVSGDLQLRLAKGLRELSVESVSGDIEVEAELDERARVEGSTVSGDMELRLNKDLNAAISLNTQAGGSITNGLSVHKAERGMVGNEALEFTLGKGKGTIELETVSGDLSLKAR